MELLRILIVDDSTISRKIIRDALSALPEVNVVGMVSNGSDALTRAVSLKPDIITLDVEMPGMNGLEVLSELQNNNFAGAVVMLSSFTKGGAPITIEALELGAFDFILKPSFPSIEKNLTAIKEKFRPIAQAILQRNKIHTLLKGSSHTPDDGQNTVHHGPTPDLSAISRTASNIQTPSQIVAIGVSTGGPKALAQIIPKLSRDLTVPVVIVQHMPQGFTTEFAKSLDSKSSIYVKEAEDGETLVPGTVYVAPGGRQMKMTRSTLGKVVQITDDPPENNCKPSVDYFFRSVAKIYAGRSTAVILTGMGKDGAEGARLMKNHGARIIAQDEKTSVVFGMPKEVIDLGIADVICPISSIASELCVNIIG